MTEINEKAAIEQIADVAREFGFEIEAEPRFRGLGFRPDIVAEHEGKRLVIEYKSRPIMLSDVLQVSQYGLGLHAGKILCTADDAFQRTPPSVKSYAKQMDIHLCGLDEIGEELRSFDI